MTTKARATDWRRRVQRWASVALTFAPPVLIGTGIGFALGLGWGLCSCGLVLWADEYLPDPGGR